MAVIMELGHCTAWIKLNPILGDKSISLGLKAEVMPSLRSVHTSLVEIEKFLAVPQGSLLLEPCFP